jgi:hypothetical protein
LFMGRPWAGHQQQRAEFGRPSERCPSGSAGAWRYECPRATFSAWPTSSSRCCPTRI